MSWTPEELKNYLARPEIKHSAYPTEKPLWDTILKLAKLIKKYR
jgi:hypothetical protein